MEACGVWNSPFAAKDGPEAVAQAPVAVGIACSCLELKPDKTGLEEKKT